VWDTLVRHVLGHLHLKHHRTMHFQGTLARYSCSVFFGNRLRNTLQLHETLRLPRKNTFPSNISNPNKISAIGKKHFQDVPCLPLFALYNSCALRFQCHRGQLVQSARPVLLAVLAEEPRYWNRPRGGLVSGLQGRETCGNESGENWCGLDPTCFRVGGPVPMNLSWSCKPSSQ
jgi:hypothetical protein